MVEALRDALLERDELVGSEITDVIERAIDARDSVVTELRPSISIAVSGTGVSNGRI